ncbi:hypothetical protein ACFOGG_04395 [Brenneria rubrifaciens]|uniref:hypothetical protein n=1 Tax=Brenneria rubrifaciens TaxID=55213 RepID=UPI00360D168B
MPARARQARRTGGHCVATSRILGCRNQIHSAQAGIFQAGHPCRHRSSRRQRRCKPRRRFFTPDARIRPFQADGCTINCPAEPRSANSSVWL